MPAHPLEVYLAEMARLRATQGTKPELSYYPPLANLLNAVGSLPEIKPRRVSFVSAIKDEGADDPDGGLYSEDQLTHGESGAQLSANKPSRGVVEAKPLSEDAEKIARGPQVAKYWRAYQQVMVTNYRGFRLVTRSASGKLEIDPGFDLAETEAEFWELTKNPKAAAAKHGKGFIAYLSSVLNRPAPIVDPQSLASQLAALARRARAAIEGKAELKALADLRDALEEGLGLEFEGVEGEHFFRSTLVQTLFYGMFSAWVIWARTPEAERDATMFQWKSAGWLLRVPMVQALYSQISDPAKLKGLDVIPFLNWAGETLNRVDSAAFFERFVDEYAIQYFYEPFLDEFDPELRKNLGVWYTPREVVRYMVERVDQTLRTELNIVDGFAAPNVIVLDPCCGTGTYLVEVLRRIRRTLEEKSGADALVGLDVKKAAIERIFGFELLPAPYVVAHLQLGLALQDLGAPLESEFERSAVYLSNALTGWDDTDEQIHIAIPELEAEHDAASHVKKDVPVLVVLGNPPYNAFAGVAERKEADPVAVYKEGLGEKWGVWKYNLDDLYVRFFRLAERRIAERTGHGIVCFISNFSFLRDKSFVVMRERFLSEFDRLWIDCLNGDSRETGKRTPDNKPDPSIFSTDENPEGIRKGTAVTLMVRGDDTSGEAPATVHYRDFWGADKRGALLKSLAAPAEGYSLVTPTEKNFFRFRGAAETTEYHSWPSLVEIARAGPLNGLLEKRGGALIAIERTALEARMKKYMDPSVSWETLQALDSGLTQKAAGFEPQKVRGKVLAADKTFEPSRISKLLVRPFETRWCYYTATSTLWNRPRPWFWEHVWQGNWFVATRQVRTSTPEGVPFFATRLLGEGHCLKTDAFYFPIFVRSDYAEAGDRRPPKTSHMAVGNDQHELGMDEGSATEPTWLPNLSQQALEYLLSLGEAPALTNPDAAALVWRHALAVGFAPSYRQENEVALAGDWPRIPMPAEVTALKESAKLGAEIAALLDDTQSCPGVVQQPSSGFQTLGLLSTVDDEPLLPGGLEITADWGRRTADGVVMPGPGSWVARDFTHSELASFTGTPTSPLTTEDVKERLGPQTLDVALSSQVYWRNVPIRVWEYHIGGYAVLKKWLSYRAATVLARPITPDEARHFTAMVRRIAAILLLEPRLDTNYEAVKATLFAWPSPAGPA